MANTLSTSGISDGGRITAAQITQLINALSGSVAYNLYTSGSITHTGSLAIKGTASANYFSATQGNINSLTSSYAITSSYSAYAASGLSSSYAVTSSHTLSGLGTFSGSFTGSFKGADYVVLTQVSQSLNYTTDSLAGDGGVPYGGLYRSGSYIKIRMS